MYRTEIADDVEVYINGDETLSIDCGHSTRPISKKEAVELRDFLDDYIKGKLVYRED